MSEDLLRYVAAELNFAPDTAERVARLATLVDDTNRRIAIAAQDMPFDSSPYAFQLWLAGLALP